MKTNLSNLKIWIIAKDLLIQTEKVANNLPQYEKYILSDQLRRSSLSVVANIAEAHNSYYYKEKVRICYIARKELSETQSHLEIVVAKNYMKNIDINKLILDYQILMRSLNAYIKSYKSLIT